MRIHSLLVLISLGCSTPPASPPPSVEVRAASDEPNNGVAKAPAELVLTLEGPTFQVNGQEPESLVDTLAAFKHENDKRVVLEGTDASTPAVVLEVGEGVTAGHVHEVLFAIARSGIGEAAMVSRRDTTRRVVISFPRLDEHVELNLVIGIRADGYVVSLNGTPVSPLKDCPTLPNICMRDGAHDRVGLQQVTTGVATQQAGLSRRLVVAAPDEWPADDLIQVIDLVQGDIWPVSLGISQKGHP